MADHSDNDSLPSPSEKRAGQSRFVPKPPSPQQQQRRPAPKLQKVPDIRKLPEEELPPVAEDERLILAPSKRVALEWGLVLSSQRISYTVMHPHKGRWFLKVSAPDHTRSLEMIHLYLFENRHWGWEREMILRGKLFSWGCLHWVVPLLLVYLFNYLSHDFLKGCGLMDSNRVLAEGEWWRVVTATFLHADVGHLASNLSLGILLFGLAMGYYGIGWALLGASLGGYCGNLLSMFLHPDNYLSLGASGVVMAALGLLSVYWVPWFYSTGRPLRAAYPMLAGSALIFVLAGLSPDPQVNVLAHLGGYLGGLFFGALMMFVPERFLDNTEANVGLTLSWLAFSAYCWLLAIQ